MSRRHPSRPGSFAISTPFAQRDWGESSGLRGNFSEDRETAASMLSLADAGDRFSQGAFATDAEGRPSIFMNALLQSMLSHLAMILLDCIACVQLNFGL